VADHIDVGGDRVGDAGGIADVAGDETEARERRERLRILALAVRRVEVLVERVDAVTR